MARLVSRSQMTVPYRNPLRNAQSSMPTARGRVGASGEPNLDDFAVLDEDGDYFTVTPKPYRGVPIGKGQSLPAEIVRQLASKPPSTYYVSFSIWDDSFDEFQTVRDALVAGGYEYRLVVVTEGDEVFYGSVVDPKVQ